jgi:dihydroxy-acid dehydratase
LERGHALQLPLDRLAKRAKVAVRDGGGFPFEFVTIAVSDGISMGHEGMHASLVSREVIADSVETVMHAERFDAMVTLAGLRQVAAGNADGRGPRQRAERLSLRRHDPAGTARRPGPRHHVGLRGRRAPTPWTHERRGAEGHRVRNACPTEGSCAGMFTANTMASVAEALGMSLLGSASAPSIDPRRDQLAYDSGTAVVNLLDRGITARQIMTKEAFENAIAVVMALGGSTNAVLHLLAIAHEARVDLTLDDFNKVAKRVPHIADTKPHGKYHMSDLDKIGGVPVVLAHLLETGLLHGDA